jgi:Transglycosylase SLT domain
MFALSCRFCMTSLATTSLVLGAAGNGAAAAGAMAPVPVPVLDSAQARLCYGAIAAAEAVTRIPDAFLSAIGRVESGRRVSTGIVAPWPWTVNAAGVGHFYATKAEAVSAVHQFQAQGVRSLDVGCLQVNLFYHPEAFASVEQAFDPPTNAAFAARLLMSLHAQTGSWPRAAAAYHSSTPLLGQSYQQKVLAAWAEPDRSLPDAVPDPAPPPAAKALVKATPPVAARATVATARKPAVAVASAPHPSTGFTRTVGLRAAPGGIGRTLAAYRTMPVRLAMNAPPVVP